MAEIENEDLYVVHPPENELRITPNDEQPKYVYNVEDGKECVGFMFTDPQAGPITLILSTRRAPYVIAGLQSVLDNIEQARANWRATNGDPDE